MPDPVLLESVAQDECKNYYITVGQKEYTVMAVTIIQNPRRSDVQDSQVSNQDFCMEISCKQAMQGYLNVIMQQGTST